MSAETRCLAKSGAVVMLAMVAISAAGACGSSDLLVGDDSREALDGALPDTSVRPDSSPPGPQPDAANDSGADAPNDVSCPELVQPAPGFCDGGPYAPTYAATGCINGFACAPLLCVDAGGTCVALSPGSCAANHFGDATKYSCGVGIGTACCLP